MPQPSERIRIGDAKQIATRINADGVVVIAFIGGSFQIASYGATKAKCHTLGTWVDGVADKLESGEIIAPDFEPS